LVCMPVQGRNWVVCEKLVKRSCPALI